MKKKTAFLSLFLFFACWIFAQSDSGKKITYVDNFLSSKFLIGETQASPKTVGGHLQKYNSEAYSLFRKSESLQKETLLLTICAAAAVVVGLTTKKTNIRNAAFGSGAVLLTFSLFTTIGSDKKRKKSLLLYNESQGY